MKQHVDDIKKVGIWLRVSTEDQAKGQSPKHHEARGKMYAQSKGWNVIEIYHLEGVSGKSVVDHPEAQRMLKDIQRGHITGLIFSKLARLARNTKQLLEFAEFFKKNNADLISLEENIDTSSPAGRLLYTMIAALSEWEREEIASRVKSSVLVRAKQGKPLGGAPPLGYHWVNKELKINPEEAPVRKLIYELFLKHKRYAVVAKELNNQGYRTRRGAKFSHTTLFRMLKDPVVIGVRRVNYSNAVAKRGEIGRIKPKEEWIMIPSPPLISEELYNQCQAIIEDITKRHKQAPRTTKHIFAGYIYCGKCTNPDRNRDNKRLKMYVRSKETKYICNGCRNKISKDDIEAIFTAQINSFLFDENQVQFHLEQQKDAINTKVNEIQQLEQTVEKLDHKMDSLMDLFHSGELPKKGFNKYYTPLSEQHEQVQIHKSKLQGEIDAMKVQLHSNDAVIHEARNLQQSWNTLGTKEKRSIVEVVLESIIIYSDEVEINLKDLPTKPKESPLSNPTSSELIIKAARTVLHLLGVVFFLFFINFYPQQLFPVS